MTEPSPPLRALSVQAAIRRLLVTASCAAMLALGCGAGRAPAPAVPDHELYGTADTETILFRPQGEPESLLGREITVAADGSVQVGDRRPGCVVQSRSVQEAWSRAYNARIEDTAGGAVELPPVAALRAKYGSTLTLAVAIKNELRLDADTDGDCGERFIVSIRVGTGERFVGKRSEVEGAAQLSVKQFAVGGEGRRQSESYESFAWDRPQAWSFTYASAASERGVSLRASMPTTLHDQDKYGIQVRSNRAAWLIVYGRQEDGRLFKLLPDMKNPVVQVGAGETRQLPELYAYLEDAATPAREMIIIYAFDDPEFAARFAMPQGEATATQMEQWQQNLESELANIPQRHWERAEINYRILPRP